MFIFTSVCVYESLQARTSRLAYVSAYFSSWYSLFDGELYALNEHIGVEAFTDGRRDKKAHAYTLPNARSPTRSPNDMQTHMPQQSHKLACMYTHSTSYTHTHTHTHIHTYHVQDEESQRILDRLLLLYRDPAFEDIAYAQQILGTFFEASNNCSINSTCITNRVGQNCVYAPNMTVYLVISLPVIPCICTICIWFWPTLNMQCRWIMTRAGQNRICTPYMTVYLVKSLQNIPYDHRIYMVLANPNNDIRRGSTAFVLHF